MLAFLILPVLVSGFIVCNYNPNFYYKIHRYQGQYLYFISACLGVASLLAFSVIAFIAHKFFPSTICIFNWEITISIAILLESLILEVQDEKAKANLIAFAWIVVISLGTILIAYFWSVCSRARLHIKAGTLEKSKILLMSKVLSDNPMDKLFFESYLYSRPLLLSLNSRKVYVGTINSLGELNESSGMDQEISLIPIMSGYRNEDTLEVHFTTYYEVIATDLNIVIRQDQILSASWFDFDIYKKLNPRKISSISSIWTTLCDKKG